VIAKLLHPSAVLMCRTISKVFSWKCTVLKSTRTIICFQLFSVILLVYPFDPCGFYASRKLIFMLTVFMHYGSDGQPVAFEGCLPFLPITFLFKIVENLALGPILSGHGFIMYTLVCGNFCLHQEWPTSTREPHRPKMGSKFRKILTFWVFNYLVMTWPKESVVLPTFLTQTNYGFPPLVFISHAHK
jgi:hypothetical protein